MSLKEKIENTSYEIIEESDSEVVLVDTDTGENSLWAKRPNGCASYAIVLDDGMELEFVRSLES